MTTSALHFNTREFPKAISAFRFVRSMSESELETLEILSDEKNMKLLEHSLSESKRNKVSPIGSIL